jgi:hypothetical protein
MSLNFTFSLCFGFSELLVDFLRFELFLIIDDVEFLSSVIDLSGKFVSGVGADANETASAAEYRLHWQFFLTQMLCCLSQLGLN